MTHIVRLLRTLNLGRKSLNEIFAEIVPDGARIPHVAYQLEVHAYRGELEAAFALMKSGIEKKQHFTTFLYDPFLKNMHADPRWGALLQQAGYDPDA